MTQIKEHNNTRDLSSAHTRDLSNSRDLSVGSCVKFLVDNDTHYGVIRWIGPIDHMNPHKLTAAIELVISSYILLFNTSAAICTMF